MNTIAHLIATNFYGGPEKQIVEHLSRLDPTKFRGVLGSYIEKNVPNSMLQGAEMRGITTFSIPMRSPIDFSALRLLEKQLSMHGVDLLCTHHYKSTIMGWYTGRRLGIPVIAFSRGYTSENFRISLYEWLERRFLGRVNGVVSVSQGQLDKLKQFGVKPRREWIIHNAVTTCSSLSDVNVHAKREVCSLFNISEEKFLIVTAGRLSPEKGHRFLIDAIGKLGDKANKFELLLCGEGACKNDLKVQAKNLGISKQCHFVGFRTDLNKIFLSMDLLVLPSLTEGLPNVVLEAFSVAKPVIATEVGGVPELVENNVSGFLVPPQRSDYLATAMEWCINNPLLLNQMGKAGYETVTKYFNFDDQTRRLQHIYENVLDAYGGKYYASHDIPFHNSSNACKK